jgi:hypothetical protein
MFREFSGGTIYQHRVLHGKVLVSMLMVDIAPTQSNNTAMLNFVHDS